MTDDQHPGSCLCGGVSYRIDGEIRDVVYCHCSQCRKTSGNFGAATACPRDALQLLSDDTLEWYRASDTAMRGFCRVCGGNLFWKPDHGDYIAIFAGTLDTPSGIRAQSHIYVADKSDYVTLADGLPQHAQDADWE